MAFGQWMLFIYDDGVRAWVPARPAPPNGFLVPVWARSHEAIPLAFDYYEVRYWRRRYRAACKRLNVPVANTRAVRVVGRGV